MSSKAMKDSTYERPLVIVDVDGERLEALLDTEAGVNVISLGKMKSK